MKKLICVAFIAVMLVFVLASCISNISLNLNLNFMVDGEVYATFDTANGNIAIPQNPEKEGMTFVGWYWDEGKWQEPFTISSILNVPVSNDLVVYAYFTDGRDDATTTNIPKVTWTETYYLPYDTTTTSKTPIYNTTTAMPPWWWTEHTAKYEDITTTTKATYWYDTDCRGSIYPVW